MGANSKIEWTDHTFSPWAGCTKVSPACDHCYAEGWAKRSGHVKWGSGQPRRRTSDANWRMPLKWNREAERTGVRPRVFCASLADVFDNAVDPQWREDLFDLIAATPNLDWLLLTKRIGNVGNMLPVPFDFDKHFPNVWIGATIVNQAEADRDIPKLLDVPARVRFLSMEPLLGPVDLTHIEVFGGDAEIYPLKGTTDCVDDEGAPTDDVPALDWVIVGGESGPGARPMSPDWARSLRDQCAAAGVPFLFKQWGEWIPMLDQAEGVPVREMTTTPDGWVMGHAGKKAAGRLLDGRTWDGFPTA